MSTHICSNGDDFKVLQQDRAYKGVLTEALKVDGKTGVVTVAGQTISSTGVIGSTGAVTATTVTASGAASAASITTTGNGSIGGNLVVTGTATIGGKTPYTGSVYNVVQAGANASGGATHVTIAATQLGDVLIAAANLTTPGDASASFETTVTVAGQLQQTITDLSAKQILFMFHRP
jgi:hypothetical protein